MMFLLLSLKKENGQHSHFDSRAIFVFEGCKMDCAILVYFFIEAPLPPPTSPPIFLNFVVVVVE